MSAPKWLLLPLCLSLGVSGSDALVQKRADISTLLSSGDWSSATTYSFPDSTAFDTATERWTTYSPPTYDAVISPATEDDVVQIVKMAAANNISFLATGGRHGYTSTLGDLQSGLAIDLSQLDTLEIDSSAKTLTVGPGLKVGAVMDPVYEAGFLLQTGTASCPGLIGVTLGGGIGRFTGKYGLMIDALASVRIVTASGTVVEASKESNSDLFWGILGAGANFGIITSATFNLNDLPNGGNIYTTDMIFPANMTSDFFKAVETFSGTMPAELAGIAIMSYDSTTGESEMMTNWIYIGSEEDAQSVLAPIIDLNPPYLTSETVAWNKLINSTFNNFGATVCEAGAIRDIYSTNLKNYSASTWSETFSKMSDFFDNYSGGRSSALQFELYPNQAMNAVSTDATAWPWRDANGYFQTSMTWTDGDTDTENAAIALSKELRELIVSTSGYSTASIFVNYAHGDEGLENIYGSDKLSKLASLKKTWDPSHMFSFNNGLPTEYN